MATSADEWVVLFAKELGTAPPDAAEVRGLLGLASIAAHASERTAAPVSCWIAAQARVTPTEAIAAARRVAKELKDDSPDDAAADG